ncbi:Na/Pi cotransporter family protein [Sagittula stellata]|uniref:Probable sodium-dependent phosphate transporter protein n=1 Tax=Sagittula stellata (strain ATCC 700073 / DSM 11524 / E-37) TaxID=388399 RepID=A3JY90_SAGS3|nr:Na/Pi cotransporter family protein [Sagittula stellata]EBA10476.1 probable sodium-dependent phosphate transporter protein [Sagittula stellata E-37]
MSETVVLLNLGGAVALLLVGLSQIRAGVDRAVGARLRHFLALGTRTGPRAMLSGLGVTLALQSSTATALLAASFAERGIMTSRQGQVAMLGANVGTAITAWVVSLHLGWISPLAILVGHMVGRGRGARRIGFGRAIVGVGLVLLSLGLLDAASTPIRESDALTTLMAMLSSTPVVALAFAALIALLSASSLAAVMMIASLAAAGQLSQDLVIPLVLGANIGGALPAVIATSGAAPAMRRLTLANLALRGFGASIVLAALPVLDLAALSDPIAAHLAFNLALLLVGWPLAEPLARVFDRLLPDVTAPHEAAPRFLAEDELQTPVVALASATREVLAVGDVIERMLLQILASFRTMDAAPLETVPELEDRIDRTQQEVKLYVARLLRHELSDRQSRRAIAVVDYVINLEHVGDIAEKGLAAMARKRADEKLRFSDEGFDELIGLFSMTLDTLKTAQTVFATEDPGLAREMIENKVEVRRRERQSAERHLARLRAARSESVGTSSLHLDMLRDLKRITAHLASVAHPILDEQGMLDESRLRSPARPEPHHGQGVSEGA